MSAYKPVTALFDGGRPDASHEVVYDRRLDHVGASASGYHLQFNLLFYLYYYVTAFERLRLLDRQGQPHTGPLPLPHLRQELPLATAGAPSWTAAAARYHPVRLAYPLAPRATPQHQYLKRFTAAAPHHADTALLQSSGNSRQIRPDKYLFAQTLDMYNFCIIFVHEYAEIICSLYNPDTTNQTIDAIDQNAQQTPKQADGLRSPALAAAPHPAARAESALAAFGLPPHHGTVLRGRPGYSCTPA